MGLYINQICVAMTMKCNWTCPYCIARYNDIPVCEDTILKQLREIHNQFPELYLSGGEPGVLSDSFWEQFFSEVPLVKICSNGTFIKRGLLEKHHKQILKIILHCVQEIDMDIEPDILDAMRNEKRVEIEPTIVLHSKNTHLLRDFLLKYDEFKFGIFITDESFLGRDGGNSDIYDHLMTPESCKEAIYALRGLRKYRSTSEKLALAVIKNKFLYLNAWSSKNYQF